METQCESAIIILGGLCNFSLDPLISYVHFILNFATINFPTATRFADLETGDKYILLI